MSPTSRVLCSLLWHTAPHSLPLSERSTMPQFIGPSFSDNLIISSVLGTLEPLSVLPQACYPCNCFPCQVRWQWLSKLREGYQRTGGSTRRLKSTIFHSACSKRVVWAKWFTPYLLNIPAVRAQIQSCYAKHRSQVSHRQVRWSLAKCVKRKKSFSLLTL